MESPPSIWSETLRRYDHAGYPKKRQTSCRPRKHFAVNSSEGTMIEQNVSEMDKMRDQSRGDRRSKKKNRQTFHFWRNCIAPAHAPSASLTRATDLFTLVCDVQRTEAAAEAERLHVRAGQRESPDRVAWEPAVRVCGSRQERSPDRRRERDQEGPGPEMRNHD
jgi:hypothetical protein